jgi:hypothetical protein
MVMFYNVVISSLYLIEINLQFVISTIGEIT